MKQPSTGQRVTVTGRELAHIWGVDQKSVSDALKAGNAVRLARDRYDLVESTRRQMQHLREQAAKWRSRDGSVDTVEEAGKLRRAQREVAEMKRDKMLGVLVSLPEVKEAWAVVMKAVRQIVLNWPNRAQVELPHLTGPDVEKLKAMTIDLLRSNSIVAAGEQGPLPEPPDPLRDDDDAEGA